MEYITIIRNENENWKIGRHKSIDLEEHRKFKEEMLECVNVEEVKILEVKEIK